MTQKLPDESILGERLSKPSVYAWRRQDTYLYVGLTSKGLRRPLGNHDVIGRRADFEENDSLDVWRFDTLKEAAAFEKQMIREHQPIFNAQLYREKQKREPLAERQCTEPECQVLFTPKRKWQKYCSTTCQYRAWSKVHRPPIKGKEVSA